MKIIPLGDNIPDEGIAFEDWLKQFGIELVAKERPKHYKIAPWYVVANPPIEIIQTMSGTYLSTHGNGQTPEQAKYDYARQLAGRKLLIEGKTTILAPNTWKDLI